MLNDRCYGKELLEKELKGSYLFFIRENNFDKKSQGYGLIHDVSKENQEISSIASVGFGFCALVIGVIHRYLKYEEAKRIAIKTLDTIIDELEEINRLLLSFCKNEKRKEKQ